MARRERYFEEGILNNCGGFSPKAIAVESQASLEQRYSKTRRYK
jgi:hypothetical protein